MKSHYLHGFKNIPVGDRRISELSAAFQVLPHSFPRSWVDSSRPSPRGVSVAQVRCWDEIGTRGRKVHLPRLQSEPWRPVRPTGSARMLGRGSSPVDVLGFKNNPFFYGRK